jgi:hypothetical protein
MRKLKKTPDFNSVAEERAFWEANDSSDYIDWSKAKPATFDNLKPSTKQYLCACLRACLTASKLKPISATYPINRLLKSG